MPSVREKQRKKWERAIIEVTKKPVGEKGYRKTSIEEIAAGDKVLCDPPAGAKDAVYALVETHYGVFVRHFSKRLMQEIRVVFMLEQLNVRQEMMGLGGRHGAEELSCFGQASDVPAFPGYWPASDDLEQVMPLCC